MGIDDTNPAEDSNERMTGYVVSPAWLAGHLDDPQVKIIETPWKRDGYDRAHIEGARCLPWHPYLKAEEDGNRSLHVLGEAEFVDLMQSLGIRKGDDVIAYDEFHNLFSTRFWWVCRLYGFDNVRVLDGGWQRWVELGLPVSIRVPEIEESTGFPVEARRDYLIRLDELEAFLGREDLQIWDTRRTTEYNGSEQTSNRRRGHLPGAVNLEWKLVLEEEAYPGGSRVLRSPAKIEQMLQRLGLEKDKLTVTHCQAGIRAAFGSFVLEMLGYSRVRCYDASMAEWANLDHTELV